MERAYEVGRSDGRSEVGRTMNWVSALLSNNWLIAAVFLAIGYRAGVRAGKIREAQLVKEWSEKVDSVFELLNVAKVALGERQVDSAFNGWIDDEGNLDKSRILGKERTKA